MWYQSMVLALFAILCVAPSSATSPNPHGSPHAALTAQDEAEAEGTTARKDALVLAPQLTLVTPIHVKVQAPAADHKIFSRFAFVRGL